MKELPLVSVVIPNYNYALFVGRCIESILEQSHNKIEIIVVDDGSTDNSMEILSNYCEVVKVIRTENFGVNHARNIGLAHCKGEYIAFCDSDDFWEREKLQKQVEIMEQDSNVILVYSGVKVLDKDSINFFVLNPCFRGLVAKSILRNPTRAIVLLGASTALIRSNFLKEKGLVWSESLKLPGEDINFFNKVALMGYVDYVNLPLVNYRQHSSSRSKMSALKFIEGNRQSFLDFAHFAKEFVSYRDLQLSWMRLNLILVKHALLSRKYITALKQVKYFLRLIPSQDNSNSRDIAAS